MGRTNFYPPSQLPPMKQKPIPSRVKARGSLIGALVGGVLTLVGFVILPSVWWPLLILVGAGMGWLHSSECGWLPVSW